MNEKSKISFITFYTENIKEYSQHSLKNLIQYCLKHNYGLKVYNEAICDTVYPCWCKVALVLKHIHEQDYLVWIDSDALITNMETKVETLISDKDLYLCKDIDERQVINSGVMIIKNTDWCKNLFTKVWNSDTPHHHNDQNVLLDEINKDEYRTLRVSISEETLFNSNIFHYKPGDFILHLMGVSTEGRIKIMRQVNTNLGHDNYEVKDCIDIIQNLSHEEIRKKCLLQ